MEGAEEKEGLVYKEVRPGYLMRDKLLRPAGLSFINDRRLKPNDLLRQVANKKRRGVTPLRFLFAPRRSSTHSLPTGGHVHVVQSFVRPRQNRGRS